MKENIRKLHIQRQHCTTADCRDDLDQKIAAAKWAVQQQQARLEKEGAVARETSKSRNGERND